MLSVTFAGSAEGATLRLATRRVDMAKGGRETKKPKQQKPKTIAAAPSTKGAGALTTGAKK